MEAYTNTSPLLAGGGELGQLTRQFDWSKTTLGPPNQWPQPLQTMVSVLLNAQFPMFLWWGPDLIQFYNDAYRPSLGNPGKHPAALGQRGEACWPEIWPVIGPLIYQVLDGGEATMRENQLIPIQRNGRLEDVYWTFSYSPVPDETGQPGGVLVTCTETTQQVQAHQALLRSEERVQQLLMHSPVAFALFRGPQFIIELANERVLEYWGRTRDEVMDKPLFYALPESSGQGFEELLTHVYTTGERFVAKELTVTLKRNGQLEQTYIDFVYEPYRETDQTTSAGPITGVTVVCIEVTEQVLARRTLQDEQNRLNTILNELPLGILMASATDELIWGNRQVEQIFRHPFRESRDIEAYTNWQLFDPITNEPFPLEQMPMVRTLLHGETVTGVEMKLLRGDDTWGYASVNTVPVYNSEGQLQYGVAAFVDVTGRKLREANQTFLANIANEMSRLSTSEEIMQTVGASIGRYMNLASVNFLDIDETQDKELIVSYFWGRPGVPVLLGQYYIRDFLTEEFERACRAGETYVIHDTQTDPRTDAAAYASLAIGAYVNVPFHHQGRWTNIMAITDTQARMWRDDEIELFRELANRIFPRLERARAEESLHNQQERTRIAIDAADMGTWEWNLLTDEVYWNEQHFRLFDMPLKEQPLTPDDFIQHVYPDDLDRVKAALDRTIREKTVYDVEFRAVRDDGLIRWMHGYGRVTAEQAGQTTRLNGVMLDIDDRKQAGEALRRSEERFQLAINSARIFAWELNLQTKNIEHSQNAGEVIGFELAKSSSDNTRQLHPDDYNWVTAAMERAMHGSEKLDIEHRVVNPETGEVIWLRVQGQVVNSDSPTLRRLIGITQNITEHKMAELALLDSQARLQKAIQIDTVGILFFDDAGNFLEANDAFLTMTGYTRQQVDEQGLSTEDITLPEWLPRTREALAELKAKGHITPYEKQFKRPDGSRWWGLNAAKKLSLNENVEYIVDVTNRRQAETALREADQRKDEFLAMLAHELRNPLAPIRNTLQILTLTAEESETITPAVDMMTRQVDQLVRLVDDLLDVSRISRGTVQLRLEQIDLQTVIQQAVEATRPLYEAGKQSLTISPPETPIYLQGDMTRLVQVVSNLLNNAAKFTNKGGTVRLTIERVGGEALLRVRDNGIGIAADQLDRIFDLFAQVDTSLERSRNGLGLGLTLVRQLVELHGGRVSVRSEGTNQGSEFTIALPVSPEVEKPRPVPEEALTPKPADRRILVIDDNKDAATTLAMLLRIKGHQTHTRNSGPDGIAAAESLQPDVILLDIGMPGMNGYATCRLIRQQPWGQSILLIALTGYGQEEDKRLSLEAGFDAHLTKPVDLKLLIALLAIDRTK